LETHVNDYVQPWETHHDVNLMHLQISAILS